MNRKLLSALCITACLVPVGIVVYRSQVVRQAELPFEPFDYDRDWAEIENIFDRDWYWLVPTADADITHAFTHLQNNEHERLPLTIKVLRSNKQFVGFLSYYKQDFYTGIIQYIAVNPEFRGKRYGQKFVEHAMQELFKQGCTTVSLRTRPDNKAARAVYERMGFILIHRQPPFIDYDMSRQ